MIKVIIADDHYLVREGLKKVLNIEVDIEVVAEAESASQLFEILRNRKIYYDLILLDISLPDKNGIDTLKDLKAFDPDIKVLILTMHPENRYAIRAIKAGAMGYLTKGNLQEKLINAIREIARGNPFHSKKTSMELLREVKGESRSSPHEKLSDREFQVLRMIGMGLTIVEIANKLSISKSTVHTYKTRILEKMGINSGAELMRYVHENKLI